MGANLSDKFALADFFSLLLLPTCDRSRLHGGRECGKLHLMNTQHIPGVQTLRNIFDLLDHQISKKMYSRMTE